MSSEPMDTDPKNCGFSLTEVLLAIGTLAIGMLFIAGLFPVGLHFATVATEQTIAAVVADEAFAKVKLYGVDLGSLEPNELTPLSIDVNEFAYPSTNTSSAEKHYYWSALCRHVEPNRPPPLGRLVQVTVFVSRKIGSGTTYEGGVGWPVPVQVGVSGIAGINELTIANPLQKSFINDGYTIVDNVTGDIYRVLERYAPPDDQRVKLNKAWLGGLPGSVWVVPPPIGGGKYPCIAIYQKVIRF